MHDWCSVVLTEPVVSRVPDRRGAGISDSRHGVHRHYSESDEGEGIEPALINPYLRVNTPTASYLGQNLLYPISYSNLSSQGRGRYLQWLADGRTIVKSQSSLYSCSSTASRGGCSPTTALRKKRSNWSLKSSDCKKFTRGIMPLPITHSDCSIS